ncbi:AAA family ATPase [Streptomyces sp. NPDC101234]|uniref:helix-turn-helix transcriptional regulator n=1 Tax=Streptomyces sp. NPDC101234 TaxID=3366138 RepID=UPI0038018E54
MILRGRTEAISTALWSLGRARRSGQGGVILITGAAGIGKTAVLNTVAAEATTTGFAVGASKADPFDRVAPGQPLLLALRSGRHPLISAKELEDLSSLAARPLLLIDRVFSLLEELADRGPLLIALDDIQWVDDLTRLALRVLPARLSGLPIVWALTNRVGSATATEQPVWQLPDVAVEQIPLGPLEEEAILQIATDWLGEAPTERTRRMLDAVAGTPFFAVQILEGVARARAGGQDEGQVPAEFVAGVRRRLAALPPAGAQLVRLAAVLGRPMAFEDAVGLMGSAPAAVLALVEQITEAGLFEARGTLLAFRHDLVRECVYADLAEATRRKMHRLCARYLLESGCGALTAAPHALAGGRDEDGAGAAILRAAADEALAATPETAGDLILAAMPLASMEQPGYWELGIRCVDILSRVQRCTEAIDVADGLLRKAPPMDVAGRIEALAARAMWLTGRLSESVQRIDAALAADSVPDAVRARLRASRALAITRMEPAAAAWAESETALASARETEDREALEVSLQALGELSKNAGYHARALRYFRELRTVAGAAYLPAEIIELQLLDRYAEAQTLLEAARRNSESQATEILPSVMHAQLWQDFNLGRLEEAEADAVALVRLGAEVGSHVHELDAVSILSTRALFRGDVAEARARLKPYLTYTELDDDVRLPGLVLMEGWLAAADGDLARALSVLGPPLYGALESRTYWPWWPGWMPVFARLALAGSDSRFAAEAAAVAEEGAVRNPGTPSFEGIALHVRGLVERDIGLLHDAAEVLQASPRPALRAGIADDLGRALLAEGRLKEGTRQLDSAWSLYNGMGIRTAMLSVQNVLRGAGVRRASWSKRIPRPTSGWQALTKAELQVAQQIGRGLTNKVVADNLGLSTNTIGTHVRSIFTKLGIHSRAQLANALRDHETGQPGENPGGN